MGLILHSVLCGTIVDHGCVTCSGFLSSSIFTDPVGVTGISTRLHFTVNSSEQCANLTLVDDDRIEALETFNLELEPVVSGNRTHHRRMHAIQCAVTSDCEFMYLFRLQ